VIKEMEHRSPPAQQIQIWRVPLSQPQNVVCRLEGILSPGERERAARFHFDRDRRRYTISQGALRTILSDYLQQSPDQLCFQRGRFGKPYLAGLSKHAGEDEAGRPNVGNASVAANPPELQFNLSHCEDLALVAVSDQRLVGVDVEKVRDVGQLDSIVDRYFSQGEKHFLASTSPRERPLTLLTFWSRREAAAKALGLNLAAALSAVKVPVYPTGGSVPLPELADLETDAGDKRPAWFIRDLELDQGHVGALCSEGPQIPVVFRDFGD
jgi:4'-phosphopantetheinyl transferase